MNALKSLENRIRGWIPKDPKPIPVTMAAQAPIMSERDKAIKLKVVSVMLGAMGVLFGGGAAAQTYLYFVRIGATAYDATVYSVTVWIIVIAIFWLAAFKLKRIQQYITRESA